VSREKRGENEKISDILNLLRHKFSGMSIQHATNYFSEVLLFDTPLINEVSKSTLLVRKYKRKQKNEMLLRRVTTSLSLRNYLPPATKKVCKKVTANISPGYNGAQKPLFVLISFCTYEKIKTEHFQIFLLYQETDRDFLILNTKGIRKRH